MAEPTQMTRTQIDAAEAAGIVTPKQAKAMRSDLAARDPDTLTSGTKTPRKTPANPTSEPSGAVIGDEDNLRFLRSFGDVFIGGGLFLLALGVSAVIALLGGGPVFLIAAVGAYALAEFFGRHKRAHFPTLITAFVFLIYIEAGLSSLPFINETVAAALAVVTMIAFYARIRLPFCIALIAISVLSLLFSLLTQLMPDMQYSQFGLALILSGLVIFAVAMLYDIKDTHRRTRFADNAFWLHLLAAPLIIHGLVGLAILGKTDMVIDVFPALNFTQTDAAIILVATGVITIIGLAINRRALIVSSLGYVGLAIGFLIRQTDADFSATISITLVLLGAAIVLLGVAWHPVRNLLIRALPRWRVFPPPYEPQDAPSDAPA